MGDPRRTRRQAAMGWWLLSFGFIFGAIGAYAMGWGAAVLAGSLSAAAAVLLTPPRPPP